ncbi:response regulator [Algoriphagus sp.]|uniref:response regulator transcription factor n=1 Tax=Algoriphagus sp. TaxID=1872435 RepID=UPI00327F3BA5
MKTILVIENHELMRLFLVNYLSAEYEVHSVASIKEAITWFKIQQADLVLADFPTKEEIMEMNILRAEIQSSKTNLVVLTDQDKSEQRIQALQWGAKDCLSKPFNPVELKLRIQTQLPAQLSFGSQIRPVA